jgi:HAD superfamily phosphatase (TIGR01668 family)
MRKYLMPDRILPTYRDVTPQLCRELGIRAILSDIDNTLAPYEQAKSDEEIRTWLRELNEAGISIALISNNHADRVELFNSDLGLIAYPDAGKPFGKCLRRAMTALGSDPSNTAMLGDQLLTDALAGHLQHLKVLIVPPIRDKRTAFVRFKRMLERPVIRRYYKKHGEEKR